MGTLNLFKAFLVFVVSTIVAASESWIPFGCYYTDPNTHIGPNWARMYSDSLTVEWCASNCLLWAEDSSGSYIYFGLEYGVS